MFSLKDQFANDNAPLVLRRTHVHKVLKLCAFCSCVASQLRDELSASLLCYPMLMLSKKSLNLAKNRWWAEWEETIFEPVLLHWFTMAVIQVSHSMTKLNSYAKPTNSTFKEEEYNRAVSTIFFATVKLYVELWTLHIQFLIGKICV